MPSARKARKRSGRAGRRGSPVQRPSRADEPDLRQLERVEQAEQVGRELLLVVAVLGRLGPAVAAQVGHDQPVAVLQQRHDERQHHQCCGQPWSRTSGSPCPASATCTRRPPTSTKRWVTPASTGIGRRSCCRLQLRTWRSTSAGSSRRSGTTAGSRRSASSSAPRQTGEPERRAYAAVCRRVTGSGRRSQQDTRALRACSRRVPVRSPAAPGWWWATTSSTYATPPAGRGEVLREQRLLAEEEHDRLKPPTDR
jgi:hypothetical protein